MNKLLRPSALLLTGLLTVMAARVPGQTATFAPVISSSTGASSSPFSLAVADVNRDGKLDVLTADYANSALAILLGNGSGGFTLQPNPPSTGTNSQAYGVVIADVNGDGKVDAVVANGYTSILDVFLGDGNGGFVLQANSPSTGTNSKPYNVALVDVNGDSKLDALTVNYGTKSLGVLLGNGSGGFTLQANSASTGPIGTPVDFVVADVNGDGKPDAVTATVGPPSALSVLLGNGNGTFTLQANYSPAGTSSSFTTLAVADVSGDGKPDVLIPNYHFNIPTNTLDILLGDNSGNFTLQAASSAATIGFTHKIAVADMNGDGKLDALLTNSNDGTLSVLLGNGSGGFTPQAALSTGTNSQPSNLAVADVNKDGKPDVLVTNGNNGTLAVFLNTTTLLSTRAVLPGTSASLYPNPARAAATLAVTGLPAAATQVEAMLVDATGRTVGRPALAVAGQGQAQATVSTEGLAVGLYVLRLTVLDARNGLLGELPPQRLSVW